MRKEELRIGNWYQSVKWDVPVKCDLTDLFNLSANADGADDDPPIDDMFAPIPITEGWLQDFGFEYWGHNIYAQATFVLCNVIDGTSNFGVNSDGGKFYPVIDDDACCWSEFKYVHQLQTLYFALTGEELILQ